MTTTATPPRSDYVGEDSTPTYDFDFPVIDLADLAIYEDGVEQSVPGDYTVSFNSDRTGSVTRVAGNLPDGAALALVNEAELTQPVRLTRSNGYRPDVIERSLDRLAIQVQSLNERIRHSIRFPNHQDMDAILPAALTRARKVMGFDASGNFELIDRDDFGTGSGSGSSSTSNGYLITDTEFGAIGDGLSHPLSAEAAADYNERFFDYGCHDENAILEGDETDFAATQCAFFKAAWTGRQVVGDVGTFRINRSVGLLWTATPADDLPGSPLVSRFTGAGRGTIFKGYGIAAGRAVFEFLGESNTYAANIEISHMQIEEDESCNRYSFCLRLGDGYCGIGLHRVICKGAQAMALRVASSGSYAQICFSATQCQFWSNWDRRWGDDDISMDLYCIVPESLGSYWDSAKFDSCFFWGQVDCRAFSLTFFSCMFINQVERALPYGATVYLGTAAWDGCYFEDHLIGIATNTAQVGVPITNIVIRNTHFSSANNSGTPANAQSSIQCARYNAEHGPLLVEYCRFGGTTTYSDIDLYGPMTVNVTGCCRPFVTINVAPTITTAGDVRIITLNPNGETSYDLLEFEKVRIKCDTFVGPFTFTEANDYGAESTFQNETDGTTSFAAHKIKVGTSVLQFTVYAPSHATLPGYCFIGPTTDVPFALTHNGLPKIWVSDEPTYLNYAKLGGLCYNQTADKTIANSSAITSIFTSGYGTPQVPAGFMRAGRKLVIEGGGLLSSTGTPTLDFYLNFDATAICSILGMAASALTNAGFYFRVEVTFRTIGATAAVIAVGFFALNGVTYSIAMSATVAVDSTAAIIVDPDLKWSVADPANTLKVTAYSVRAE